jgi:EmrB/QacA subfamily drug resistance transporter
LGDEFGRRRVFVVGLVIFSAGSVACSVSPTTGVLVAARAVQGVGGALLVPGSMSIIGTTIHPDDRPRAYGLWSGLAGAASAVAGFLGGWLIDAVSWRLIFLINVPLTLLTVAITLRHVPETKAPGERTLDLPGAALVSVALGSISYAAIEHHGGSSVLAAGLGVLALVGFVAVERRSSHPMLPLRVFRSRQFSGTNLATFAIYAGLGGAMFLLALRLQVSLGYSALEAGSATLPFTVLMLFISPAAGQVSQRIGARVPMTVGPLITAVGIWVLSTVDPGDQFGAVVLPGVVLLGLGMAITVAPLTAAVLGSVGSDLTGVASGVSNAVARTAGMLAVAALPALAGITAASGLAAGLDDGYRLALQIAAGFAAVGGLISALLVRRTAAVPSMVHPSPVFACHDSSLAAPDAVAEAA